MFYLLTFPPGVANYCSLLKAFTPLIWGAIHSSKISGNFGLKLYGPVWSNRKSFFFLKKKKPQSTFRRGPFFSVGPVRSKWTVPLDHPEPFSIPESHCSVSSMYKNEGKCLSLHFYGLLTGDLSLLLVHPCTFFYILLLIRSQWLTLTYNTYGTTRPHKQTRYTLTIHNTTVISLLYKINNNNRVLNY